MRKLVVAVVSLVPLTGSVQSTHPTAQDWEKADVATVRLKPSAFTDLSTQIRADLERRGCTVPQVFDSPKPHNVIRGHFTSASQIDVAVLCSRNRVSSILVFRGGSTTSVEELASRPDSGFLQTVGPNNRIGYSRGIDAVGRKYIMDHYERYGGPKPPALDHDGINDAFVLKASTVWYWYGGKWLQLQGAD